MSALTTSIPTIASNIPLPGQLVSAEKRNVRQPRGPPLQASSSSSAAAGGAVDLPDANDKLKPMKSEYNRYQSYINWPHEFLPPRELARAGFFFTQKQDLVRCAFCSLELGRWKPDDKPQDDHKTWSSRCPFLVDPAGCGNQPMSDVQADDSDEEAEGERAETAQDTCGRFGINLRATSVPENGAASASQFVIKARTAHPQHATLEARLQSFADWPVSLRQRPAELADAGFYYSGKSDQTICFSCGGGLKSWEEQDVPWEQHAIWFPKCSYLRLQKTPEYIQSYSQSSQPAKAKAEHVPSRSAAVACLNVETTAGKAGAKGSDEQKPQAQQTMCKICYSKEVGVVFLPCGHMISCVDCAPALTKCAVCRSELQATVRAFLS